MKMMTPVFLGLVLCGCASSGGLSQEEYDERVKECQALMAEINTMESQPIRKGVAMDQFDANCNPSVEHVSGQTTGDMSIHNQQGSSP